MWLNIKQISGTLISNARTMSQNLHRTDNPFRGMHDASIPLLPYFGGMFNLLSIRDSS